MFENLVEILKANPRKIVYTEGTDARILESAARLKKDGFLTPVLVGNVDAVKAAAAKGGFDAGIMCGGADDVRRRINEMHRRSTLTANEEDLLVTMEAVYEMNMRGYVFAPIDLYHSHATKFLITDDGKLRPPFVAISGLGETAAWDLMRAGESGQKFISVQELSAACPKVSQAHIEQLRTLGALDEMPDSNQINLFEL